MTHPFIVRATHWINAAATLVLIMSGLQIHNAYPILPFQVPGWMTLGGWLGGALLWHFAAMWVLALNWTITLLYGVFSGRFRRKLWPLSAREFLADLRNALRGRLAHADTSRYNAIQKFSYVFVIVMLALTIASGIALWKPVQFAGMASLFGGFDAARVVHFVAMVGISAFLLVHVVMSLLVPRSLLAMIRGR